MISTRPGPAGGTNGSTAARSGTLSNTTSHPAPARASTACTDATGSRGSTTSRAPSWAASTANSAASTAGSSAGNCQHTPTSARCRCAYSTATLVLPAPPSPHNATSRGPDCPGLACQPGIQLREQPLPARQEHRPRRQPHRQAGHLRPPLVLQRADSCTAPVGSHRSGAQIPRPGCGYGCAGPGGVGFGGATFP